MAKEEITQNTNVYLADTIGEMGLLYQIAPAVFVGGSLIKFGGQNMLEPMRLSRTVLIGPHAFNFREIVKTAKEKKALIEVEDKIGLQLELEKFFSNPEAYKTMQETAHQLATSEMTVLDRVWDILHTRFNL